MVFQRGRLALGFREEAAANVAVQGDFQPRLQTPQAERAAEVGVVERVAKEDVEELAGEPPVRGLVWQHSAQLRGEAVQP
jgi:hypothetical protein